MPSASLERPRLKERHVIQALIIYLLQGMIFLLPIVFLPFTFEIFDFVKQNVLWFLTFAAAVLWLAQALVIDKKVTYKKTPLDIPIVIMLVVWGLGTVFSVDWFSSLFGYYGRFSDAYLSAVSFALFYFLAVNTLQRQHVSRFLNTFLLSGGLALSISLLVMFGAAARVFHWGGRWAIVSAPSFNVIGGSAESLALFAAAALVLVAALGSYSLKGSSLTAWLKIKYGLLACLSFLTLIAVNFLYAWVVALISFAFLLVFTLYTAYAGSEGESGLKASGAPALFGFIVCLFFILLFNGSGSLLGVSLPREVVLPINEAREISWGSVKTKPLFGYGPGDFAYAFSAHRPASFNQSQFWQLRFDKAPAYLIELISTVGILGFLSYLAVAGVFLFVSFIFGRNMFRNPSLESCLAVGFSFMAFLLFSAQAVYLANTALLFCFWFALTLAMINWRLTFDKIFTTVEIDLRRRPSLAPVVVMLVIVSAGLFFGTAYLQAKYYLADVLYNNFRLSGDASALERANALNPRRFNYRLALARRYLVLARDDIYFLSSSGAKTISDDRREALKTNVERAITEAKAAADMAPKAVMTWELLGAIYRDVRFIAVGSIEPAIRYLEKASGFEPTNPVLLTERGNLYASHSQANDAVAVFGQALVYKPDYMPARIGLAKVYDSLGQTDKALVVLEEARRQAPSAEVVYESGRLYYNQNKLDTAIERFNEAIGLRPDYANAIYSLGLVYQKQGESQKALEQFEKVKTLNQGNEAILGLVEELPAEN